jgi:hypothetical protein
VRLLLPGPVPHRVVVSSRHTLAGLGARLLDVTALDEQAGVALLDQALRGARPGDGRIGADGPGAAGLVGMSGGPLALQMTAALLKADPSRTVSGLVGALGDEVRRLEALRYDDGSEASAPSVAAAFELSYRQLGEVAARVFRLLPINPGSDISTAAAVVPATCRPMMRARRPGCYPATLERTRGDGPVPALAGAGARRGGHHRGGAGRGGPGSQPR